MDQLDKTLGDCWLTKFGEVKRVYTAKENPDEIKLSREGKIFRSYLESDGMVAPLIRGYDHWICNILPTQIANRVIQLPDGICYFTELSYLRCVSTPAQCRDRLMTYNVELRARMFFLPTGASKKEAIEIDRVSLGRIPIMIGSRLSHFAGKSAVELTEMYECANDPGGYFIIRGVEKLVIMQEKIKMGRPYVWLDDKKKKTANRVGSLECRMSCPTRTGSSLVSLKEGKIRNVRLYLSFLGKNANSGPNSVNVITAFQVLGHYIDKVNAEAGLTTDYGSLDRITETILDMCSQDKIHREKVYRFLGPSLLKAQMISNSQYEVDEDHSRLSPEALEKLLLDEQEKSLYNYFSEKMRSMGVRIPTTSMKASINGSLFTELFPQVTITEGGIDRIVTKYNMLADMLGKMLEVMAGLRDLDDRDSWGNRRLVIASGSLEQLFYGAWGKYISDAEKSINDKRKPQSKNERTRTVRRPGEEPVCPTVDPKTQFSKSHFMFTSQTITKTFTESFTSEKWGVEASAYTQNITDVLSRHNLLATYSHLQRVSVPTNAQVKEQQIRLVQPTQLGYICYIEAQEGPKVGIVKEKATGCSVTIATDSRFVWNLIQNQVYPDLDKESNRLTKCVLDGVIRGWCVGEEVTNMCKLARMHGEIDRQTAIVYNGDNAVHISCDSSRPSRLLFVMGNNLYPLLDPSGDPYLNIDGEPILSKPGSLIIDQLKAYDEANELGDPWESSFQALLHRGAIEWIDPAEQETIYIAENLKAVELRQELIDEARDIYVESQTLIVAVEEGELIPINPRDETSGYHTMETATEKLRVTKIAFEEISSVPHFTHAEMDPQAILGVNAAALPFPDHNQGPRTVYASAMGKQGLGIYHSNQSRRFDTGSKLAVYPQRRMVASQMSNHVGLDSMPIGQNVFIAYATGRGASQEDNVIMNQAAIDRGFGTYFRRTVKRVPLKSGNVDEKLAKPTPKMGESANRYENIIGPRPGEEAGLSGICAGGGGGGSSGVIPSNAYVGLPVVGSYMSRGQCVVGKISESKDKKTKENTSLYVGLSEDGWVEHVYRGCNTEDATEIVKVSLVNVRKLVPGDKVCSQHAQKVTLGETVADSQMPFVSDRSNPMYGQRPTIIVNPHSFISRMTIGMMIELLTGYIACMTGKFVNATVFQEVQYDAYTREMERFGFHDMGKTTMIDGKTLKPIETKTLMAMCYYLLLRHQVKDKIQVRSKGPVNPLTRQPLGGRNRGCAQRSGEMERDAYAAHGATSVVLDRLLENSDPFPQVFCPRCGVPAIVNYSKMSENATCKHCKNVPQDEFVRITYPYATKLLGDFLTAVMVRFTPITAAIL